MDLPEGFHREVVEAKVRQDDVDFTKNSIENSVSIAPLKPGGANFRTHVLMRQGNKMLYKPSYGVAIFSFIFLAVGLGMLFFAFMNLIGMSAYKDIPLLIFLAIGLVFALVGGLLFYSTYKPIGFDKSKGYYFKGYGNPEHKERSNSFEKLKLSNVIALQIIGETVRGSKSRYNSFELNLVLKDGTRTNIVDHGNLKSIVRDAEELSAFMDLPIWHAKTGSD